MSKVSHPINLSRLERGANFHEQATYLFSALSQDAETMRRDGNSTPNYGMGNKRAMENILSEFAENKAKLNTQLFGDANIDHKVIPYAATYETILHHQFTLADKSDWKTLDRYLNQIASYYNLSAQNIVAGEYLNERKNIQKITKLNWAAALPNLSNVEIEKLRVAYGEARKGGALYITTSPLEMLLQGANAHYVSCNSPHHEYYAEAVQHAMSKIAFAIFDVKADYSGGQYVPTKAGRLWAYLNNESLAGATIISTNGGYGAIQYKRPLVVEALGRLVKQNLEMVDTCTITLKSSDFRGPGYFDIYNSSDTKLFTYSSSRPGYGERLKLRFDFDAYVPCLICGDEHESDKGFCDYCLEDENMTTCEHCGDRIHIDNAYNSDGGCTYCYSCYHHLFAVCSRCHIEVSRDEARTGSDDRDYCEDCFLGRFTYCEDCDEVIMYDGPDYYPASNGHSYCESCYQVRFVKCAHCDDDIEHDDLIMIGGRPYCGTCADAHFTECEICGRHMAPESIQAITQGGVLWEVCADCLDGLFGAVLFAGSAYTSLESIADE